MSSRPNLFDYAPSELSQDAFLLWLANYADPRHAADDAALCQLGQRFVRSLLDKVGVAADGIRSVRTNKQLSHVDVAIVVNEEVGLIIEDKTDTRDHDDQLEQYLKPTVAAQLDVAPDQLHGVYLKTGNEAGWRKLPARWDSYTRNDLLTAIGHGTESGSDIARDFIERLRRIDRDTEAFRSGDFLNSDLLALRPGVADRGECDDRHDWERDVPVLDRQAEQQHHGERGAAPAQTAALLLDDDVDRLLLAHVDDRTASSLMLRAM